VQVVYSLRVQQVVVVYQVHTSANADEDGNGDELDIEGGHCSL